MARIVIRSDNAVVCPYCKHEHDAYELEWGYSNAKVEIDIECENCEKEFWYMWIERNPYFESYKKEDK